MKTPDTPRSIAIDDFRYDLPESRIALFPLQERDRSKLLVYREGNITDHQYTDLPALLPQGAALVFNNTRVVQARLVFFKPSGGAIELFCLEPDNRYPDITTAMSQTGNVYWTCLVGGANKWKDGQVLSYTNGELKVEAHMVQKNQGNFCIRFTWAPAALSFAEVLHQAGKIPIPPYIKRDANTSDLERYQTVYAKHEGSVAAPTAGLHFTNSLLQQLQDKGIGNEMVTLHVGAGTFQPVKAATMDGHSMHAEFIELQLSVLERLLQAGDSLIAVGTTSLRTLETFYWMGVKAHYEPGSSIDQLAVTQWEVYETWADKALPRDIALEALINWMKHQQVELVHCKTSILIAPGYTSKMVRALITNFHQPQSTLLLLVAALIGNDWKKVYTHALENEYRFLSYGDGSLLWYRLFD